MKLFLVNFLSNYKNEVSFLFTLHRTWLTRPYFYPKYNSILPIFIIDMLSVIRLSLVCELFFYLYSCQDKQQDPGIREKINYWNERQSHFTIKNRDSLLYFAKLIQENAKNLPVDYQAMGLIGMAKYHSYNKVDLSMKLYEQALALLAHSKADSLKANVYAGLGLGYKKKSDYALALEYFFKALRIYEKQKYSRGIGAVLSNIGEVYQLKFDLPTAKKYILQAIEINKSGHNGVSYLAAMQTLANIYGISNNFDSALIIDRIGIAAADSMASTPIRSIFYNNMGNCYMYMNKFDSAHYYFTQCLALDSADGNLGYMADNYLTLGELEKRKMNYPKAEQYFAHAILLADSIDSKQFKFNAWNELSEIYRKDNKLQLALDAKDSGMRSKDLMINQKTEEKIAELRALYESDKKEQMIALQQSKLSKQQLVLIGGAVLMLLLFLTGWLWYHRYKIKKEKELQLELIRQREMATLDILKAEEQERKRVAAELHDGVGQVMIAAWLNLQVLEDQLKGLEPGQQNLLHKATGMVGESCKEVRHVSHAMMPTVLQHKGFAEAVKDFTNKIDSKIISIQVHIEGLEKPLETVVETILYRVIQEAVNNTIKHAHATQLDISLYNQNDGITLLIEDNGKGFDKTNIEKEGLGLQNMKSRIAFLQGTIYWESSPGNGTLVSIYIPAKNEKK